MTRLDPSVEYRPLIMIIPRRHLTERQLPEGYHYQSYDPTLEKAWIDLQCSVGLFKDPADARAAWQTFVPSIERFLFVADTQGNLVGSAGLWPGTHFGPERLRLHDVAVREDHQHKGIAQAMICKLSVRYDEAPGKYPLYVVTQTNSYGAVALYSRLGFTPYLGAYQGCTEEQNHANWEIATKILREKVPA
ncbi:MAG: GNAT family N-acetyltransferase [Catenisphaera adipataccumulans]|jgi:ribosomal protein S18 acetylase RimI-like enzyme|uniref:GNAT family N-acetyltransferase n=1 Tax=Catenisphaera adipataccumulans TaxID=700500 RepID=UPI003D8F5F0E